MIRAILDGRKTQTRRVMRPQPPAGWFAESPDEVREPGDGETPQWLVERCPYGAPGDRLWVRETFWQAHRYPGTMESGEFEPTRATAGRLVHYDADGVPTDTPNRTYPRGLRNGAFAAPDPYAVWLKKPSIFMPRWASRITLEITEVRVQRLQEINDGDAIKEGLDIHRDIRQGSMRLGFAELWDSINGKRAPWSGNPFVWCLTFRRLP